MSLMVSNIRLPFDVPEEQALAEARRLTGLASRRCAEVLSIPFVVVCLTLAIRN